jgi:hypothetical protein
LTSPSRDVAQSAIDDSESSESSEMPYGPHPCVLDPALADAPKGIHSEMVYSPRRSRAWRRPTRPSRSPSPAGAGPDGGWKRFRDAGPSPRNRGAHRSDPSVVTTVACS